MEANNLKIRCSRLGALMTEPKLKGDKDAGNLSETAKSMIDDIFLENEYGYVQDVFTDAILKGLLCEQDSMALVQHILGGEFRIKNQKRFENDFICGTPDIILSKEDIVEDIKTSYDLKTFFNAKLENSYFYQAQGYMHLTGKKNFRLIYCLVNSPFEIVTEEKKRWYFKFGCDEENTHYLKCCENIDVKHNFDNIPIEKRIKVFNINYDAEVILKIQQKVEKAREYYKLLEL